MTRNNAYMGKHARKSQRSASLSRDSFDYGAPQLVGRMEDARVEDYSRHSGYSHSRRNAFHGKRKARSRTKAIILSVALVILLVVGAGSAYAAWYLNQINNAISYGTEDAESIEEVTSDVDLSEPFYMLVMGSDSREGSGTSSNPAMMGDNERSDVMMLLRVDASNHQLTMVSIPRDTPYAYPDGTINKINETYNIGGAAMTIKAVEDVTGVDIAHFAEVRFSDLEGMIDALGGVTVDVDTELSYKDALTGERVTIEPGEQMLNGQQAQIFARARHEYETDQDMHRQQNVRQLAISMMKSVLSKPSFKIPGIVLRLAEFISTDLKAGDLIQLVRLFADGEMTLYSCTGPSLGDINEEAGGIWLCFENPLGWAKLMDVVDAGEDPSGLDVDSTAVIPEESKDDSPDADYQTEAEYLFSIEDSYYFTDELGGYYDYSYDYSADEGYANSTLNSYEDEAYAGDTTDYYASAWGY